MLQDFVARITSPFTIKCYILVINVLRTFSFVVLIYMALRFLRCTSNVGMQGGEQKLTIADECDDAASITHLILHALGLWHEQSRPDRDQYVEILWENIYPGKIHLTGKSMLLR